MFPRSANKPMQAAGMLRCGLDLDGELLALAAASHSGEDFHVAGVREILARAGLTEDDLQCPRGAAPGRGVPAGVLREGGEPDRVHMNCSGKHAAMLATCVAAGWPTATYPTRRTRCRWRSAGPVEGLAGEQSAAVGVDGCGAPVFALSLAGLARAFQALVTGCAGHAGAPGGRRDAGLPGMDVGEPAHGAGADGRRPGPAAQGRGRRACRRSRWRTAGPRRSRSRTARPGPGTRSRSRCCAGSA